MAKDLKQLCELLDRACDLEQSLGPRAVRRPTRDSNRVMHALDMNVHTMVAGKPGRAEVLRTTDGPHVQRMDGQLTYVYAVSEQGRVKRLRLDLSAKHKEETEFRSVAEAMADLEVRIKGLEAEVAGKPIARGKGAAKAEGKGKPEGKRKPKGKGKGKGKGQGGGWAAAEAAVGKPRKIELGVELPALGVDAAVALAGLELELGREQPIGMVEALRAEVDAAVLDQVACKLAEAFVVGKCPPAKKWAALAAGRLGGDATAALLGERLAEVATTSAGHHTALAIVACLERIGTPLALHEIFALECTPSHYSARRNEARAALERAAGAQGLPLERLIDVSVPAQASGAVAKRIALTQARRFEQLMVDGRARPFGQLAEEVLAHDLLAPLAERLVWRAGAELVRFAGGGALGADGRAVKLTARTPCTVAHPAEGDLGAFRRALGKQPFAQIDRAVHRMTEAELGGARIDRYGGMYCSKVAARLFEHGWWEFDADGDRDMTYAIMPAREGGAYVEAKQTSDIKIDHVRIGRRGFYGYQPDPGLTFAALHEVTRSELLAPFEAAGGGFRRSAPRPRPAPAAAPAPRPAPPARGTPAAARAGVLAQTGRFPYAELAKSARSTCVVCSQKIDKGALRIAVERDVATAAFTGRVAVYLHDRCRTDVPELTGMADLDARLSKNSAGAWPAR